SAQGPAAPPRHRAPWSPHLLITPAIRTSAQYRIAPPASAASPEIQTPHPSLKKHRSGSSARPPSPTNLPEVQTSPNKPAAQPSPAAPPAVPCRLVHDRGEFPLGGALTAEFGGQRSTTRKLTTKNPHIPGSFHDRGEFPVPLRQTLRGNVARSAKPAQ